MLARLWKKHASPTNVPQSKIDTSDLDRSFSMLRSAATQVTEEAAKAAKALEDQHNRIRACFTALNSASDVIFIVDSTQNVYFCNDMFVHQYGYNDYEDVVGKQVSTVVPGLSHEQEMWDIVKQNKTWQSSKDNRRITVVPMMNGAAEPKYYVCTIKEDKIT